MARGKKVSRSHARVQREEASDASDDSDVEEVTAGVARSKLGGQPSTAGMMPPSDSEDEEEEEEEEETPGRGQASTVGKLPPNDSDDGEEDEEDEDDEEDDDDDGDQPRRPAARERVAAAPVRTAKEISEDIARLEAVRKRRAEEAARRIAQEGFDRFAPPPKQA